MAKVLINGAQDELRIAIINEKNKIRDLIFEHAGHEGKLNNIYKGVITGKADSLNAFFVNFGAEKHGFLPFKDAVPATKKASQALSDPEVEKKEEVEKGKSENADKAQPAPEGNHQPHEAQESQPKETLEKTESKRPSNYIQELTNRVKHLNVGDEIIVQVDKEERGNKGAALTGEITLAGRYLVLMPNTAQAGGISRRIEGEERELLREQLKNLNKPDNMGVIIRTSGLNKTQEELQWDLDMLLEQWEAIKAAANEQKAPFLIHQESGVVSRIIRDYLSADVDEILVDDKALYDKIKEHLDFALPKFSDKVKLYTDYTPLFSRYGIENQIEAVYQPSVRLPSGGSIVIDHTEALVSIDVNSSRSTRGGDIEETAFQTNLEAAEEIARHLRLRDIGGLVVIDFIDMTPVQHQKEVEARLKHALRADRARVQVGRISRFGLLEMSRQRLKPSLREELHISCPRCKGQGTIRTTQSIASSILRVVEEDAIKGRVTSIHIQAPLDIASFLTNEKREKLAEIEKHYGLSVVVIPNLNLQSPHYHMRRSQGKPSDKKQKQSHELLEEHKKIEAEDTQRKLAQKPSKPAVEFSPSRPAPVPLKPEAPGLFKRLLTNMFSSSSSSSPSESVKKDAKPNTKRPSRQNPRSSSKQERNRSNNQRRRQSNRKFSSPPNQKDNKDQKENKKSNHPQKRHSHSRNRGHAANKNVQKKTDNN